MRWRHIHPLWNLLKFQRLCNFFESHVGGSVAKFLGESLTQIPLLLWEPGLTFIYLFIYLFIAQSNLARKAGASCTRKYPNYHFPPARAISHLGRSHLGQKKFEPTFLDSKDWLLTSVGRFSLFFENRRFWFSHHVMRTWSVL
jgi:hypothetical protein